MYKNFSFLPKKCSFSFKLKGETHNVFFTEPTIYKIFIFEDLLKNGNIFEALKIFGIKIESKVVMIMGTRLLDIIIESIYGKEETSNSEDGFFPSTIDFVCSRYGINPLEFIKTCTPSQLSTISAGAEFNINLQNDKSGDNSKFRDIKFKLDEKVSQKYEDILKKVREREEKMK